MEFKIKNKTTEIKFNYRLMFKMNKKLATKNPETGELNGDGVGAFFSQILNQNDQAIVNLIQLVNDKATEEDALKAIEEFIEENDYDSLFDGVKDAMVDSGFFVKKISKYIESLEKVIKMLSTKEDEETQMQVKALQEQLSTMKATLK